MRKGRVVILLTYEERSAPYPSLEAFPNKVRNAEVGVNTSRVLPRDSLACLCGRNGSLEFSYIVD